MNYLVENILEYRISLLIMFQSIEFL